MKTVKKTANGRVNLIGEHTDYNGGWVLPTAIPQTTTVTLTARDDMQVIGSTSADLHGATLTGQYILGQEKPTKTWIDYIQGGTWLLKKAGHAIEGFDITVTSTVPTGSGLSSSAALEVSFLKALTELYALPISETELARIGQQIENEFVGAKVGIMDQMACTFANFGQALFLDTKLLEFRQVELPVDQMDLVVINSGLAHQNSGGDYNQRRSECEKACEILGIKELREFSEKDLSKLDILPDVLKRRSRHVITENARVHAAVKAIEDKDVARLGKLFFESHASMRDDFQVSIPEIDQLVEICLQDASTLGAR
ncbi:MAG: galactokinase, partial [Proteobacteria bacterium]